MSLEAEMNALMDNSPEVDDQDDLIEVGVDGVEKPVRSGVATKPAPTGQAPAQPAQGDERPEDPDANLTPEELRQRAENYKAAMRDERARRQAEAARARRLEAEYQNAQRNWQDLMTRMASQGLQPPQQAPQGYQQPHQQPGRADPAQIDLSQLDVENAPIEVLKATVAKIQAFEAQQRAAYEAEQRAQRQREDQQQRQADQIQTIRSIAESLRDDEAYFRTEEPHYDDAASFYVSTRERALKAAFPGAEEAQIKRQVLDEILQATYQAVQSGRSPAQLIFAAAKEFGWQGPGRGSGQTMQPAAAPAPAGQAGARMGAPAPAKPDAPAQSGVNPADPLAHIRAGQAAARSAGAGGAGSSSGDDLSLKDILSLKGAAYSSASEKFLRKMRSR